MRLSPIRVRTLPCTRTTQPIWLDNFTAADKILAATIPVRQSSSRFRPLLMGGFTWPHKTAWWFTDCFDDAGLVTFCQSKEVGHSPREPATSIAELKLGAFPFIRRGEGLRRLRKRQNGLCKIIETCSPEFTHPIVTKIL